MDGKNGGRVMGSGAPDSMWIREINTIKAERDKAIADREKISRILYEREEVGQRQIDELLRRLEYEKAARMSEQQTTEWGQEARWVRFQERFPSDGKPIFAHMVGESEDDGHLGSIRLTRIGWFFMDFPIGEDEMAESWEWLELRPKEKPEPVVPLPDGIHEVTLPDGQSAFISDSGGYYGPAFPLPDGRKKQLPHDSRSLVYESYLESLRENEMGIKQLAEDHEMFKDLKDLDMLEADEMDNSEQVVPVTDERPDWLIGAERWYEDMRPFLQPIVEIRHDRNGEFPNLSDMFDLQAELNEHLDASMIAVAEKGNERDIAQWTQNLATAMQQELAELLDCVPWKWWANYQDYDRQNARVEIADLFHFLISMAQLHGMTAQDVFETYKAKCQINHKRHESGYKHKNPNDCKDI